VYKQSPFGSLNLMNGSIIAPTGGGQPHNNMQPCLTLNFCIALQGVFPPRQ
jgi:microcystin-dependent protein